MTTGPPRLPPRAFLPTTWREQQVMLCGRFGEDGGYLCLPSKEDLPTFGYLAVHPGEYVVLNKNKDPSKWQLQFKFDEKTRGSWVVTHVTSGLRLSRGADRLGYRYKVSAQFVAEMVTWQYGQMMEDVPTTRGRHGAVTFLQAHPQWDEMVSFVRDLEKKYTYKSATPERRRLDPAAKAATHAWQRIEAYEQRKRDGE